MKQELSSAIQGLTMNANEDSYLAHDAKPIHSGKVWVLRHTGEHIRWNVPKSGKSCVTFSVYNGNFGIRYGIVSVDKVMLKDCGYISLKDVRVNVTKQSDTNTNTNDVVELMNNRNDRTEPIMAFTCSKADDITRWVDVLQSSSLNSTTEAMSIYGSGTSKYDVTDGSKYLQRIVGDKNNNTISLLGHSPPRRPATVQRVSRQSSPLPALEEDLDSE